MQGQVFTVVNDESYYYPDLISGMIVDHGDGIRYGQDIAKYTGSSTGDSFDNVDACSTYGAITWHVDRKCHLVSASSFDKLCADLKATKDGLNFGVHPEGSRGLVTDALAADNQASSGSDISNRN